MFEYNCTIVKVIDGDTVDVDIDLGFGAVGEDWKLGCEELTGGNPVAHALIGSRLHLVRSLHLMWLSD